MATIELLRADRQRIPTEARCTGCGECWTRHPLDVTADELVLFGLEHRCCADR